MRHDPNPTQSSAARGTLCAIIVTYDQRHEYLARVLGRLVECHVDQIVVVYNGNQPADGLPDVVNISIINAQNLGSAGGFRAGIEAALRLDVDYLLLLDDDNLPATDCIERLCTTHALLGGGPSLALQAFRPAQPWQCAVLHYGVAPIGRRNTYGWFNLANERYLLGRQLGLRATKGSPLDAPFKLARIELAAYGGLFLRRDGLLALGELPDPRYFCYYDDFEFSSRLVRRGLSIRLCADAVIEDMEASWHVPAERVHPVFSPGVSDQRVYLDLRNAFIFYRTRQTSRALYALNGLGFWLGLAYLALFRSADVRTTQRRLALILRAVRSGTRGQFIAYGK
ncbi:MAG TPA: glycosyltransferase [Accumulibacter sp.]|nr:glycosyltransferase [Accumulibacter sp.]